MTSLIKWGLVIFLVLMIATMMYSSKDFALTTLLITKDIIFGGTVLVLVGMFLLFKE